MLQHHLHHAAALRTHRRDRRRRERAYARRLGALKQVRAHLLRIHPAAAAAVQHRLHVGRDK
eukprot:4796825-Prymnesium_polylepis.1